ARNFQSLPVSLIGISLATAVFPFLASDFSLKKNQEFSKNFETTFRRILFFVMPAAAFMALLSKRIISLFLGTGKFDEQAILLTAGVLMIFSLAIPFESLNHLLNRTFYARKNTHLPVAISLGAMAINISACYFLIKFMAVRGLSLAFLLAVIFQSLLLLLFTKIKVKGINFKRITIDAAKILTMTIVMGLAMSLVLKFFPTHDRITSQLIGLLAVGLIGGFSYLILAYLMKVNELDFLITKARRWLANRD
ncbi:polysaccharide biosynthesis C-terminal domain-containing protein, partial [Patescibacteria group bacterium]|nr:polysaccharide biosynthesis C-terminal domain-containing protein [Patescibacteria group bacterium]